MSTNHVLLVHFWESKNQAVWSLRKGRKQSLMDRSRNFTNLILVISMPEICEILPFTPRINRHILNIPYRNLECFPELKKSSGTSYNNGFFLRVIRDEKFLNHHQRLTFYSAYLFWNSENFFYFNISRETCTS